VNVLAGHSKGHQSRDGGVIGTGPYIPAVHNDLLQKEAFQKGAFLIKVEEELRSLRSNIQGSGQSIMSINDAASFHRENYLAPSVNDHIRDSGYLESHIVCFGCLFGTPTHVLHCGHALCDNCVMNFSEKRSSDEVEMSACPLCPRSSPHLIVPWKLQRMPPYSGLRILSLDG
jgi:hypothetical protein